MGAARSCASLRRRGWDLRSRRIYTASSRRPCPYASTWTSSALTGIQNSDRVSDPPRCPLLQERQGVACQLEVRVRHRLDDGELDLEASCGMCHCWGRDSGAGTLGHLACVLCYISHNNSSPFPLPATR